MKIVVLANSFKEGGRCLAGVELDNNNNPIFVNNRPKWIRPICNTAHCEVPNEIALPYQILDIIEINNIIVKPDFYQTENVFLGHNRLSIIDINERS